MFSCKQFEYEETLDQTNLEITTILFSDGVNKKLVYRVKSTLESILDKQVEFLIHSLKPYTVLN